MHTISAIKTELAVSTVDRLDALVKLR